jgi:hypothetical protein
VPRRSQLHLDPSMIDCTVVSPEESMATPVCQFPALTVGRTEVAGAGVCPVTCVSQTSTTSRTAHIEVVHRQVAKSTGSDGATSVMRCINDDRAAWRVTRSKKAGVDR